jgi:type I restriction enzyme, S subunit
MTKPKALKRVRLGDVLEKVVRPVDVMVSNLYQEIGVRSHGKGIFHKKPILGASLGEKRVFHVEPNCLVLNIVFAWEQAITVTTEREVGMIASHRFPMWRSTGNVDVRFLALVFQTKRGRELLSMVSPGGAGRNKTLNQSDFEDIELTIPPLVEQLRIVDMAATWTNAIDKLEGIVDAKRRRKAGLLQTLLANTPQLPLLDLADVWFSGVDKKTVDGQQLVRLCNYMDVFHNAEITSELQFMQASASAREIEANALRRGDVVFTKDSETAEEIAESALVAADFDDLVCGYHLAIARPRSRKTEGEFLAQAMRYTPVRHAFARSANGVVRFGLTLDALEQIELPAPPLSRQREIASILWAEDRSTAKLVKQLDFLRVQRRGLLQKVLTGEWRLLAVASEQAA